MDAFEDIDIATWDRVLAVNVKGTGLATRLPRNVVPALLFLCSPESDFVVGQNWVVDGIAWGFAPRRPFPGERREW